MTVRENHWLARLLKRDIVFPPFFIALQSKLHRYDYQKHIWPLIFRLRVIKKEGPWHFYWRMALYLFAKFMCLKAEHPYPYNEERDGPKIRLTNEEHALLFKD